MRLLQTGFTLIEILISLFIFTILSLIMAHAMHTVFTTQTRTHENAETLAALQFALSLFSQDIQQAVDRPIINAKSTSENAFLGSATQVTFTRAGWANPDGQFARSTLQRTGYLFEKNNFTRQTWPALDQTEKTLVNQRILLSNIEDLHFEYLDMQNHFQTTWPADLTKKGLPKGIKLFITLKNGGSINQFYVIPSAHT